MATRRGRKLDEAGICEGRGAMGKGCKDFLSNPVIGKKVKLRPKCLGDVINDYAWQKDAELSKLDATIPVFSSFGDYLANYAEEFSHFNNRGYHFAIETLEGKHVGNCACFNIDEDKREAELGIMIGDKAYWDKGYGTDAVISLLKYLFRQTKLGRIYLKTLDWNFRAQKCFQKCGFKPCDKLNRGEHHFIVMGIMLRGKL